jgi:hypothetical protein
VSNDDCALGEFCSDQGICSTCPEGSHISPVTGLCITNGTCPSFLEEECAGDQQICCGPETDKPAKCEGKGKDGGNRSCYEKKSTR